MTDTTAAAAAETEQEWEIVVTPAEIPAAPTPTTTTPEEPAPAPAAPRRQRRAQRRPAGLDDPHASGRAQARLKRKVMVEHSRRELLASLEEERTHLADAGGDQHASAVRAISAMIARVKTLPAQRVEKIACDLIMGRPREAV